MTDLVEQDWVPACARSEISDGDKLEIELPNGDFVLLLGVNGKVIAVCGDCPHQDTPLAEGSLIGSVLTCPVHFWQWDVESGEMLGPAELPLPSYDVREDEGQVFIRPHPVAL